MKNKKNNFEEELEKLKNIVNKIESGELSLNEMVANYKEATRLITECQKALERAVKEIKIVES